MDTYFYKAFPTLEDINLFLSKSPLPSLHSSDRSMLNAPLTIDVLGEAFDLSTPAKSPGDYRGLLKICWGPFT